MWEHFRWTVLLITHDIRGAVFLSDRVYVLTARLAEVRTVEDVHLPRPRALNVVGDPEFWELEAKLLLALREESERSHVQDDGPPAA